ncbi:MAG: family 16 glycoside hydrolase, partial [Opitutae bacterium]
MKTTSFLILLLTCLGFIAWTAPRSKTKAVKDLNVATKDPDFAIQGEYGATSEIGHKGKKGQYGLQVVALGDGNFQAALYKGGLPGSGAENNEFVLLTGSTEAGKTTLKAKSGETVIIKGDTATGTKGDKKLFAYDRVERKSPTLGKKAPKGAKVLFAGVEMDRFSGGIKLDGDLLEEGVVSLDSFGDFSLHLEFRTPYKPSTKPGNQDRGNSGVYIFNNYETQILDSFGIKGEFNFCGALYRKKAP